MISDTSTNSGIAPGFLFPVCLAKIQNIWLKQEKKNPSQRKQKSKTWIRNKHAYLSWIRNKHAYLFSPRVQEHSAAMCFQHGQFGEHSPICGGAPGVVGKITGFGVLRGLLSKGLCSSLALLFSLSTWTPTTTKNK